MWTHRPRICTQCLCPGTSAQPCIWALNKLHLIRYLGYTVSDHNTILWKTAQAPVIWGIKSEHSLTSPQYMYVTRGYSICNIFLPFSSFIYSNCSLVFSSSLRSLSTVPFLIFTSSLRREFFCFSMLRLDFKLLTNLSYAVQRDREKLVCKAFWSNDSCFWHHVPPCWLTLSSIYFFFFISVGFHHSTKTVPSP